MFRASMLGASTVLLWLLSTVFAGPARAELNANDLNAELLKTRDEVKAPLEAWQAAVTKKTQDEFDTVKANLGATWKDGRAKAVEVASAKLNARRQAIADLLVGEPERLDRVSKKLKEQFDGRKKALEEAGAKFDMEAAAFQVPTGANAKDETLKKLAELTKAALAPASDAEWGKVFESVKTGFAEPTAQEKAQAVNETVKEAVASVQKFVDAVERDFSRIVRCTYTDKLGTLVCDRALAVNAAEISTIEVSGLPNDKIVTVSARVAKDAPSQRVNGQVDPESDFVILEPGQADKVSIDVHLRRAFNATYKEGYLHSQKAKNRQNDGNAQEEMDERVLAAEALRTARVTPEGERRSMILIVSGRAPQISVQVKVGDGTGPNQLVTTSLELGYARWGVDSGGFFAVTWLSDEQLQTEPSTTTPNMVQIKRRGGGSDLSEDTGIFLNLVPKNYPILGIGLGFSANKDQANTFYLGPSLRLLSFRNHGVASFSIGATLRSVKRFPGLDEGMTVSANDPRLQGKNQLKAAPYVIVQLGFSFGRIPGGN